MNHHATIDHALGDHAARYFGEGHKGTAYKFDLHSGDSERINGRGVVFHEGLWSHKDSGDVSRHLSTIDSVALSIQALEKLLEAGPVPLSSLFVTDLMIKAGSSAVEDPYNVEVSASGRWVVDDQSFVGLTVVGSMKLELRLRPLMGSSQTRFHESGSGFYCEHLKRRTQHITDLSIECDGDVSARLSAVLGELCTADEDLGRYSGIQPAHAYLFSVSEAIVCLAQLAQVMGYEHDSVDPCTQLKFLAAPT